MASATDADARRERGRMPAAASDQASNEADASVPPSRFVAYPTVSSVARFADVLTPAILTSSSPHSLVTEDVVNQFADIGAGVP